jgi:hypothetical protein
MSSFLRPNNDVTIFRAPAAKARKKNGGCGMPWLWKKGMMKSAMKKTALKVDPACPKISSEEESKKTITKNKTTTTTTTDSR